MEENKNLKEYQFRIRIGVVVKLYDMDFVKVWKEQSEGSLYGDDIPK